MNAIEYGMARAFFASAWANVQEDKDIDDPTRVNLSNQEIMDLLPEETDPAALHAARTLVMEMERANASPLAGIWDAVVLLVASRRSAGDRELTAENFGHYCAMQAMGHGVGLRDAFGQAVYDTVKVPYVEFGAHSLEKDY